MNCQNFIKYSDILDGKYDMDELPQYSNNTEQKYRSSSTLKSKKYETMIHDLLESQTRCVDDLNQLGYILNQGSQRRQSNRSQISLMATPQLQMSQISQITTQQTPSGFDSNQFQSSQYSPNQRFYSNQNENILDQIDKLIKIKKLDQQILLRIIRKHMNQCPQFLQLVKQEFRNSLTNM